MFDSKWRRAHVLYGNQTQFETTLSLRFLTTLCQKILENCSEHLEKL